MKKNLLKSYFSLLFILFSFIVFAQNSLSGSVTDENNDPVIGASVKITELSIGSSTDLEGQFLITKIPSGNYEVTVSAVGYNNVVQLVQFNADIKLGFTLKEDVQLLDEAVVVGYGTARTKDLTGSAVAISEDKFLKGSLATPEQLIMGKVPGLKVTSNDGAPGSGSTLRIRGGTSINASNDPLIVIDGVPIDNGGIAGAANPLSLINPNDIESFVVLKDASASAIYGLELLMELF